MTYRKLINFFKNPHAQIQLFCFPYAGSDIQVFRNWHKKLSEKIQIHAIQLRGRGVRFGEAPLTRIEEIVDEITPALFEVINASSSQHFALFGHSFGGLLAFECSRRLQKMGHTPAALLISSSLAPQLYQHQKTHYHTLSDTDLLEELVAFEGVPRELLKHRELLDMLLPIVRADMEALENYEFHLETEQPAISRLHCPILTLGGESDSLISRSDLLAWQEQTTKSFDQKIFPGGHFYFMKAGQDFYSTIENFIFKSLSHST